MPQSLAISTCDSVLESSSALSGVASAGLLPWIVITFCLIYRIYHKKLCLSIGLAIIFTNVIKISARGIDNSIKRIIMIG